ncbi:MAG: ATP-binding protein [Bacteroidales bacterium]|nr:ATP-binding protein [Bacteroidales bacterium]
MSKAKKYINPFPVLDYYSPKYFCNRNKELNILLKAYKNNRNIVLTSIRRLGKTALIKHLFYHIEQDKTQKIKLLYFDILKTQNMSDFVKEFGNKLIEIEAKNSNWFKKLTKLISGINANISINEDTGIPNLQFAYKTPSESEHSINESTPKSLFSKMHINPLKLYC